MSYKLNGHHFLEFNMFCFCRRTADVRSVGYSSLFTLYKDDVLLALQDYPQAEVRYSSVCGGGGYEGLLVRWRVCDVITIPVSVHIA